MTDFHENYHSPKCNPNSSASLIHTVDPSPQPNAQDIINHLALKADPDYGSEKQYGSLSIGECLRENSLLYLLLMLGTVWLGLSLYNFTKT